LIKNPDYDNEIKTKVKESPRAVSSKLKNKTDKINQKEEKENGRSNNSN